MSFIRLSILAVASAALVACGGGAKLGGGKEGAAKALFEASQPAGKGGQGNLMRALASGATAAAEVSVDCAKGGSVDLKLDLTSIDQNSGSFKYELEYNDCNEDGVNKFDGKMTMQFKFATDGVSAAKVELKLKGKIEISGDIDDYLDADITETIDVSATTANSGTVTVKLNGSIKTSAESYTYNNETISITVGGELPMDDGNS